MVKCFRDNIENNYRDNINDFLITCHGAAIFNPSYHNQEFNKDNSEVLYLKIPKNIQIITYNELFESLYGVEDTHDGVLYSICQTYDPKIKNQKIRNPQFIYENCYFPNLYFNNDYEHDTRFYSGIVHCQTNCIIYNIDAYYKNKKCTMKNIKTISKQKSYNVKKNNFIPNSKSWTECGPLDLSRSINNIMDFNLNVLNNKNQIKIHLHTCSHSYPLNKLYLEDLILSKVDHKKFIKLINSRSTTKSEKEQIIDQLNKTKNKYSIKLVWKKKIPTNLQKIIDIQEKKIFYYFIDNTKSDLVIKFIFRSEYDEHLISTILGELKDFFKHIIHHKLVKIESLYNYSNHHKINEIVFDFSSDEYKINKNYQDLNNLSKLYYGNEDDFKTTKIHYVLEKIRKQVISQIKDINELINSE